MVLVSSLATSNPKGVTLCQDVVVIIGSVICSYILLDRQLVAFQFDSLDGTIRSLAVCMVSYIEHVAVCCWLDASSRHTIVRSLILCNQVELWSSDDFGWITSPLIAIRFVICTILFLCYTLTICSLIVVEVRSCNIEILESLLLL